MEQDKKPFTVTEISNLIREKIEQDFSFIKIQGEVSGLKIAPSGHVYFSLKDNKSVIACICWRGSYLNLKNKPKEGDELVCFGNLTTYAGQSKYQLIVSATENLGIGALMEKFEELKKKLAQEGLFNIERKKPIPYVPRIIGVVTSPTGSVIRDIIHRLEERFPCHVIIWPVLVQGEGSRSQVANAILGFNQIQADLRPDVIIVARGGGSIEDLWSFNEEEVIRAASNSKIPLISAIGHETDVTLLDFVADKRAPTPTAAAEMVSAVKNDLEIFVRNLEKRLIISNLKMIKDKYQYIRTLFKALPTPNSVINLFIQKLDELTLRHKSSIDYNLKDRQNKINNIYNKIPHPKSLIENNLLKLKSIYERLYSYSNFSINNKLGQYNLANKLLSTLDYKNTLKRGYAIVRTKGEIITCKKDLKEASNLEIEFQDGKISVQ